MEEILGHLTDAEWLKTLVSERFPGLPEKITKHFYHHDDEQDESSYRETREHYPQKGIRLYRIGGSRSSNLGSAFPCPVESEYIFLLETGEFASVKYTHSRLSYKSSMIHDAMTETTDTQMRILTKKEIERNKEGIADFLLNLLAQQTGRPLRTSS